MAAKAYKFDKRTGGTLDALDSVDGVEVVTGDFAIVLESDYYYTYIMDADSGLSADGANIIEPVTNAGTKRWVLQRIPVETTVPVGSIIAWAGGHYAGAGNVDFMPTLGNTIAEVNALLNDDGWYVCDGSQINVAGSPIFDGIGRYLPLLTDDRFIMGSTAAGTIGGSSGATHTHTDSGHTHTISSHTHTLSHTHTASHAHSPATTSSVTLTTTQIPSHAHAMSWTDQTGSEWHASSVSNTLNASGTKITVAGGAVLYTGGSGSHAHSVSAPWESITTSAASASTTSSATPTSSSATAALSSVYVSNVPKYLSCFYIMKVI